MKEGEWVGGNYLQFQVFFCLVGIVLVQVGGFSWRVWGRVELFRFRWDFIFFLVFRGYGDFRCGRVVVFLRVYLSLVQSRIVGLVVQDVYWVVFGMVSFFCFGYSGVILFVLGRWFVICNQVFLSGVQWGVGVGVSVARVGEQGRGRQVVVVFRLSWFFQNTCLAVIYYLAQEAGWLVCVVSFQLQKGFTRVFGSRYFKKGGVLFFLVF